MENDTIRASSGNALVDIWLDGKMRAICVTRVAIEAYLGLGEDRAAALTDEERCEFVRTNLSLVTKAAKTYLQGTDPLADTIVIDGADLGPAKGGDRRRGDRRSGERRKVARPDAIPPQGDRRRSDRRSGERRTRTRKDKA